MRNRIILFGIGAALSCTLATADIDLSDFDDDLMRGMDDAIKDLEPVIAAKNVQTAKEDAEVLRDGLKWAEDYFAKKGNVEDGVKFAQRSQEFTTTVLKALAANDLDTAATAARALSKACSNCHDAYKPLTK